MKATTAFTVLGALSIVHAADAAREARDVDETYPYTGPAVPIGDWVDPTVNGNGKGFPRLVEPPAVKPATKNPTNNVNVIALSYIPNGINIHYQTPFGLGVNPTVSWGTSPISLSQKAAGYSHTYDRTPPCSMVAAVTQCSQFYHEVQISNLKADTTYYYQIPAANGTTASEVLTFTTARAAGDTTAFTAAILNDMGYTNAAGTYKYLSQAVDEDGLAFAWHGGDISYADDWYSGILPCESDWPVCYNGTSTELPGGFPIPEEYLVPVPEGEVANQGGPQGGDMSTIYESNWDLWQQWMNSITAKIPYMVLPGNHEASCSEFDGPKNILTAYLNNDIANGSAAESALTYYSCPPSQRNFTAYQNRFRMPGDETGGVGNMWYSFDYGLAHFISLDGETDFADSPEWPFARDLKGGETRPKINETFVTDSGPFGTVGNYSDTQTYEQYQWLVKDLESIDRMKTPWVIAMTHRPMYSSQTSSYQKYIREAFEDILLQYEVDAYISGHIHWYERLWPLTGTGAIDSASIVNNNTYYTNPGKSMTHIINGAAGNIESHSTLNAGQSPLNITAVLDYEHFGFIKLHVFNSTALSMSYIEGDDGAIRDYVTLLKPTATSTSTSSSSHSSSTHKSTSTSKHKTTSTLAHQSTSTSTHKSTTNHSKYVRSDTAISDIEQATSIAFTTEVVTAYTTYCPAPTSFTEGSSTYTVTEATTLTITNCPCTRTSYSYPDSSHEYTHTSAAISSSAAVVSSSTAAASITLASSSDEHTHTSYEHTHTSVAATFTSPLVSVSHNHTSHEHTHTSALPTLTSAVSIIHSHNHTHTGTPTGSATITHGHNHTSTHTSDVHTHTISVATSTPSVVTASSASQVGIASLFSGFACMIAMVLYYL